jgi:hypothetical protein
MLISHDAHGAVLAALSGHAPGSIVSTHELLARVRVLCDEHGQTDEDLLKMIVREATGRTMIIHFDHRAPRAAA